jgi:Ca-activated chloride channel family protein
MTPAVDARPLRRKTIALLAASAAVAGAAALLTARSPAQRRASTSCGGSETEVGGMRVAVRPESCKVLRGSSITHVAVEVTAPDGDRKRQPIAMGLVIDHSGSMRDKTASHHPMRDAKDAARRAIDSLTAQDSFSLVGYSTDADTLVSFGPATEARKAMAREVIEKMYADGGTNISDGLKFGAQTLREATGQVDRVVLISDGQPTEGISNREGLSALAADLAAEGISITTVGVGLEFDERVMTEIAVAGRGNYYFVENTADLGAMFAKELGSIGETVAVDARLEVTPMPGVEVVDAYGYRIDRVGGTVSVPIADLRAGETRKVVVQLRVQAGAGDAMDLVATRMLWREVGEHQGRFADGKATVSISDDASKVAQSRDPEAGRRVQEAKMANAIDEATAAYEQGDTIRANQILEAQAAEGAAAARDFGDVEMERKLDKARQRASGNMTAPSGAGKARGTKTNRADAYELSR